MVLRLGKGRFAVVGTPNKLDDFFFHDEAIFGSTPAQTHALNVDPDTLAAYNLLPKPSGLSSTLPSQRGS